MSITLWQIRRGYNQPPAQPRYLSCGPLHAIFEPETGFLRHVYYAGDEALRGIYAAVRDHNWDTVTPKIRNLTITEDDERIQIQFSANCTNDTVDFHWAGSIRFVDHQKLIYRFEGEAKSNFRRNRIGFCVLHPTSCAGKQCTVEHVDGSAATTKFPESISPHQPLKDIRQITHKMDSGIGVSVRMTGDTFEMEDQRNWTDASFKTYCTPLELPFPVELTTGHTIEQDIIIQFEPNRVEPTIRTRARTSERVDLCVDWFGQTYNLPEVGVGASSIKNGLDENESAAIHAAQLSHIRYDIYLGHAGWADQLQRASRESGMLGLSCEIALFVTDNAPSEFARLSDAMDQQSFKAARWIVFHENEVTTGEPWIELAKKSLAKYGSPVGAGTNAYFTELNRRRVDPAIVDFFTFSINPQVHAFDDMSLVETLAVQEIVLKSARRFAGGKPIIVSPVTFRPRFNPNATGPEPAAPPGELPSQVDPRQMSLFGAAWTLGSLRSLILGGASSITYYETIGWRGVMETVDGSPLPRRFPSIPEGVFPLYHVLADFGQLRREGGVLHLPKNSHPSKVCSLALSAGEHHRLIVSNLTIDEQSVVVSPVHENATIRTLDESTYEAAARNPVGFRENVSPMDKGNGDIPLTLAPYGTVTIDMGGGNH